MVPARITALLLYLCVVPWTAQGCGGWAYPAPPTLDKYPERLPGKTMRELLRETSSPISNPATFDELSGAVHTVAEKMTKASPDDLRPEIEAALARNRAGEYRKRFANCLYDFRDLLALGALASNELEHYVTTRFAEMDWDDGLSARELENSWGQVSENGVRQDAWARDRETREVRLESEIEKASPALRPHWQVLAGAWQFKNRRWEEALKYFEAILREAPEHPRAEVALLMVARVRMEQWGEKHEAVAGSSDPYRKDQEYDLALSALDAYAQKFPEGRFARDISGWMGGLALEAGRPMEALEQLLPQLDETTHPEIVRGAVRECERCLEALTLDSLQLDYDDLAPSSRLPLDAIARHPIAALALVYHFLDAKSREDFATRMEQHEMLTSNDIVGNDLPMVLQMRRKGQEILPLLATAVSLERERYAAPSWRSKYLALLAWATSETGHQAEALRLCEPHAGEEQGDDLLFVRAVALQRSGDLPAAIVGYRLLQAKFPKSPLTTEVPFRLVMALRDHHEAGAAYVEITQLLHSRHQEWITEHGNLVPAAPPAPPLHLDDELAAWADTLLNFSPPAELERVLAQKGLEVEAAGRLSKTLKQRYLAEEDFAAALRVAGMGIGLAQEPPDSKDAKPFTEESWRATVTTLARLTQEASASMAPAGKARVLMALADTWAAARGWLTFGPFDEWQDRDLNARVLGLTESEVAVRLENRDELRHASRYYLQAADSWPGSPLAARAFYRAGEAIRQIAEPSRWSAARAFATDASQQSRQIYERLQREYPDTAEAKSLSAWWSFAPPSEHALLPGVESFYGAERQAVRGVLGLASKANESGDSGVFEEDDREFWVSLADVAAGSARKTPSALRATLAELKATFVQSYSSPNGGALMNTLDDLLLFLEEPALTQEAVQAYFQARMAEGPPSLENPALQPWRDYLVFLALVREKPALVNPGTGEGSVRPMPERMRAFLTQYPRSRKREAAMARLAMSLVREAHGRTHVRETLWPDSPRREGYHTILPVDGLPALIGSAVAALDDYESEFPSGRYGAEMRLWRGVLSIDQQEWKAALANLCATLDDASVRDLHLDAALNLASIFMRLVEQPEHRRAIIAALQSNPAAQQRLHLFISSDSLGSRLRCLEGFLVEQKALPIN